MSTTSSVTKLSIPSRLNDLESSIKSKTTPSSELKAALSILRSDLEVIKHLLAPYDLQQYTKKINELASLAESADTEGSTGRKFKFSRMEKTRLPKKEKPHMSERLQSEALIQPTTSERTNEVLKISERNPILQSITSSIIIFSEMTSLQLFAISDSIIHIPQNATSNFLKDIKHCTIILGSNQQTRLHGLRDVKVIAKPGIKVIMEDCKEVKVSKGVVVDDFDSPLGGSENFEEIEFSGEFEKMVELINSKPDEVLKDLGIYLSLI